MTIDPGAIQTFLRVNGLNDTSPDSAIRDVLIKANYSDSEIAEFLAWKSGAIPTPNATPVNLSPASIPIPQVQSTIDTVPKGRFSGRLTRKNYFLGSIVLFFIAGVLLLLEHAAGSTGNYAILAISVVVVGVVVIISLSLSVRRLHDTGHSWLFLLFNLIPYLGSIGLYLYLIFARGDEKVNEYGSPIVAQPFWKAFLGL